MMERIMGHDHDGSAEPSETELLRAEVTRLEERKTDAARAWTHLTESQEQEIEELKATVAELQSALKAGETRPLAETSLGKDREIARLFHALERIVDIGERDEFGNIYTTGEGHATCQAIARQALAGGER